MHVFWYRSVLLTRFPINVTSITSPLTTSQWKKKHIFNIPSPVTFSNMLLLNHYYFDSPACIVSLCILNWNKISLSVPLVLGHSSWNQNIAPQRPVFFNSVLKPEVALCCISSCFPPKSKAAHYLSFHFICRGCLLYFSTKSKYLV